MDAKKKFRLKRRSKTSIRIAYACLMVFTISLVTIIILGIQTGGEWSQLRLMLIIVGFFLPLLIGMICSMYSAHLQQELRLYMRDIRIYRARKTLMKVIQHLQNDELKSAIDEYKNSYYPEKTLDDHVYGMVIMACYYSKDEYLHKQGINRIFDIKKRFNPDKIF